MTGPEPVIEVHGLTAGYGGRPVLRQVGLSVAAGEVVAVLGANGSGKSTLIRTILGLVPLERGNIRLFGVDRDSRAMRRNWRRIGYVPQRLGAGGGVPATVGEIVSSGRLGGRGLLRPATGADRAAVAAALRAVGLADRVNEPVASLSGGQQQRTLIARALAGQPELLILDEPTAGVDAASQEAFAYALRTFVAGAGTVLLVAHELGPLEPLVTRAVVVNNATIAHHGGVPTLAGQHVSPTYEHVHPHAPADLSGLWTR
jgi:zinc transport system ATP-binding protein